MNVRFSGLTAAQAAEIRQADGSTSIPSGSYRTKALPPDFATTPGLKSAAASAIILMI